MDEQLTRTIAIIGAVTGTIGTIAGLMALGWDIYKWRHAEKVALAFQYETNLIINDEIIVDSGITGFALIFTIRNIGKLTTTISDVSLYSQPKGSLGRKLLRSFNAEQGAVPALLSPGEMWTARVTIDGPEADIVVRQSSIGEVRIYHTMDDEPLVEYIRFPEGDPHKWSGLKATVDKSRDW